MAERILIIDDDERLAAMLRTWLGDRGLSVEHRADGQSGLAAARSGVDAVILDVMLPDMDGFEVCRRLRAVSDVPVIMLTARGDELDRIIGLEIGADDYLPKPFNPRELLARLKAVLRRRQPPRSALHVFGPLEIDPIAREIRLNGEVRPLTAHQFALLEVFVARPGRVLGREQLMELAFGNAETAFDRSVDVHISRIRQAIEPDPANPRYILTVRGTGYLFTGRVD